jgi:MraZ protein
MALFLSTTVNKIDKKGRVSVPARWRAGLSGQSFHGIVAYPSFINTAIDASGIDRIERLSESIDRFDPFSEERNAFGVAILANSRELPFDSEGRVVLSEDLIAHAGLADRAAFVGQGAIFQIWQPEAFASYEAEARTRAREGRNALRLRGSEGPDRG